jgi:rod shape determining protein RodA
MMTLGASPAMSRGWGARANPIARRTEWLLIISAASLSILGAFLVWSATNVQLELRGSDPQFFFKRHLLNTAIGIVLCFAVSRFDHRLLRAYTPILYALAFIGLVVVLTPLGVEYNGAQNWIPVFAGFTIQPSELAKPALIVGMAFLLAEKRDAEIEPNDRDVILTLVLAGVPMVLIMLEPDLGTTLVIAVAVLGVLAVSGARRAWVIGLFIVAIVGIAAAMRLPNLLEPYQKARLSCFADPSQGVRDFCYNAIQARIAIGAGGANGEGLFKGQQTQGGFVPFNQTDFIFSVVGEELGLTGGVIVIVLMSAIIWRALVIAARATDLFGRLIATGIVCWFGFQVFENIGMNLGIMPITGVPLPFMSYGGTSMFACWIAIGLLINVSKDRQASRHH